MHFLKVKCNQELNLEQLRKKEWFYAHKKRCFKSIAIFGNV